jgi:hypothetical protein
VSSLADDFVRVNDGVTSRLKISFHISNVFGAAVCTLFVDAMFSDVGPSSPKRFSASSLELKNVVSPVRPIEGNDKSPIDDVMAGRDLDPSFSAICDEASKL